MKDVSEGLLVAAGVLVELAVVSTHLQLNALHVALLFGSNDVFFEGSTAAQVGDLRLVHALTFLRNQHLECSQVSFTLHLFLSLILLRLDGPLDGFDVALEPPFLFQFLELSLADGLLTCGLDRGVLGRSLLFAAAG